MWILLAASASAMAPAMDVELSLRLSAWSFTPSDGQDLPVGDFDGDGFDDLVVPEASLQGNTWGLAAFSGSSAGPSSPAAWTAPDGILAVALDADGDGFDDLVVQEGSSLALYLGSTAGLSSAPAWIGGFAFADGLAAGDLDGDGRDDLVVRWDDTYAGYGVEVWLNGPGGLPARPSWTRIHSGLFPQPLAVSVAVSDLDGDGVEDLALGNPTWPVGQVEVHLGRPGGPAASPDWTIEGLPALGRGLTGFGFELAGGVDLDGDGFQDLGVAYRERSGSARVARILGGARGGRVVDGPPLRGGGTVDLAPCRDVDGDGRDELLAGWPLADRGGTDRGAAAILYGGSALGAVAVLGNSQGDFAGSSLGAGDFDGDGQEDWAVYALASGPGRLGPGSPAQVGVDLDP